MPAPLLCVDTGMPSPPARPPSHATGIRPRLVAAAAAVLLSFTASAAPVAAHESAVAEVAGEMVSAAERFLMSLDQQQRKQVVFEFDDERRTAWHYLPSTMMATRGGRAGLTLKDMTPAQRTLAHGLLSTALSHRGYLQSTTIIALEQVLFELENNKPARDPELYHLAIFGEPSTEKTWGWSFEGHHLSINLTLVEGRQFSITPSFFGANPAKVREGPFAGVEALPVEQNLARELVTSLDAEQRELAVIAEKAPRDIITTADRRVSADRFDPPEGIPFSRLSTAQQTMLRNLVAEFTVKYRPQIIHQLDDRLPIVPGRETWFAWAGGFAPGEGHYWRVQTPDFLFEYDNTQNDANHIHTAWRQFDGDFGEDLLKRHYETSPHHHE